MYEKYIKRIIDIILSFTGIIILIPVWIILGIAIKIDDPGPVLFKQKRIAKNKNGEKQFFNIYKYRSMKMCTPHDMPTHMLENPEKYITRLGAFLRKTSLDELPQIFNIFFGQMSFIGPRPALWNQDDLYLEREALGANNIKPGLTGWAQINGRDELEISQKAKLDGDYTKELNKGVFKGIVIDIICVLKTVVSVIHAEGIVEGGTGELRNVKKVVENEKNSNNRRR